MERLTEVPLTPSLPYPDHSMPLVLTLGWLFVPVYISAGVYTLPEYLQKRFGGSRLRIYLSVLAIVLYIVTKLAVSIFAGALFIQMSLGWNMYVSIVALLVVTGVYTVLGGLAAVMYTDALQTVIMTLGAFALVGISMYLFSIAGISIGFQSRESFDVLLQNTKSQNNPLNNQIENIELFNHPPTVFGKSNYDHKASRHS